ncbi:MAG: hypothetical protein KAT04_12365 [Methylococcales bacterium]|nr:hypothetical protein [Methylococcales bacterium]
MKQIKFPSTLIILVGSLSAFWLAGILNAGFNAVGVMIILIIPVLIANYLFPDNELEKIMEPGKEIIIDDEEEEFESHKVSFGELVDS